MTRPDWWEYIADDPMDNQPRVPKKPPGPKTVGCVACQKHEIEVRDE